MSNDEQVQDAARRLGAPEWRIIEVHCPRGGDDVYGKVEVNDKQHLLEPPPGGLFRRADMVVAVNLLTGETRVVKNRYGASGKVT